MRLPSLLVAIFSAMVVADSSWSSFQEDNAIDDIGNPYSQPEPGSLSAQSDSVPTPDWVASTDLIGKNAAVFEPDCTGFEYTLCCTGIQTEDWNETDGKFFSITNCEKCMTLSICFLREKEPVKHIFHGELIQKLRCKRKTELSS